MQAQVKINIDEIFLLIIYLFLAPPKPSYKWLQNDVWLNLVELSKLYQFGDILNSVNNYIFFFF